MSWILWKPIASAYLPKLTVAFGVAAMHSVHASPLRDVSVLPVTAPDAGG